MKRLSPVALLVLAAACGGGRATPADSPAPVAASATEVVEEFMQAVADSNLTRMGQLWGTTSGSAAATRQPPRWREQVVVMQAYLRGGTFRIIGNVDTALDGRRQVTIELDRGGCTKQIPFIVVRLGVGSWLVSNVDISQAGNPARPCGED